MKRKQKTLEGFFTKKRATDDGSNSNNVGSTGEGGGPGETVNEPVLACHGDRYMRIRLEFMQVQLKVKSRKSLNLFVIALFLTFPSSTPSLSSLSSLHSDF